MNAISSDNDGLIRETEIGDLADHIDEITSEDALQDLCPLLNRVAAGLSSPISARFARRAAELAECARLVERCDALDTFLGDLTL